MTPAAGTLPIRRWLALAVVATFLVPAMVMGVVAVTQFGPAWHASGNAAQILRANATRWNDPAWQKATTRSLAAEGIDFTLVVNGRTIDQTSPNPLAGTGPNNQRSVQQLIIPGEPHRVADIYSGRFGPSGGGAYWLIPLSGLGALLLTLAVIAWFLGRTLVRPLAATSNAARTIAAGDLDIALPPSRVREVLDLETSFLLMSAELRATLHRQAALEEERRLFIGAIAHDLRTPLFSLRGYLEGLEQGVAATPQKAADYVRISREKADALERLVDDLFAYTRIEYLEQTLRREPLLVGAMLCRVVEGRQREARENDITLRVAIPREECVICGDEHLLARAVENLLDNALRYTPSGGIVEVRLGCERDVASISVADTGPGIPRQDIAHLFEPLYRSDASRSRATGGTGLGLTIARRIFRAHGGDLVAANRPGGGAELSGSVQIHQDSMAILRP